MPEIKINDFSVQVATVNGSGSQTANTVLMRSIFQMGVPVSGKNLFPSNIAGLPTWFTIRVAAGQGMDATAALEPTAGGALALTLYDADGQTVLAQDAAGSAGPHVEAGPTAGARFFLRVAGVNELVRNRYDLTLRVTGP